MKDNIPNELRKSAGIYEIRNLINGRVYIGMTTKFKSRYAHHLSSLKRGVHRNEYLQNAFNSYGENAFTFSILKAIEKGGGESLKLFKVRLLRMECDYIQGYKSAQREHGYNLQVDPRWLRHQTERGLLDEGYAAKKSGIPDARYGERCHLSKLTKEQVKEVRILIKKGCTTGQIASIFKVSTSLIGEIRGGFIWKDVWPTDVEIREYTIPDLSSHLGRVVGTEEVKQIKYLLSKGYSIRAVNLFFNQTRAGAISRGETYTDICLDHEDVNRLESTDLLGRVKAFNDNRIACSRKASNEGARQSFILALEIDYIKCSSHKVTNRSWVFDK